MTKDTSEITIRIISGVPVSKALAARVADIHIQTFTGFFLTFLGKGFLTQLYKGFCAHPKSGLIYAEKGKQIIGFLAYSEDLNGFYKYLIATRIVSFFWYSIIAVFRKPSSVRRLLRAFTKPSECKRGESYIELASIGVMPEMKQKGIGSQLIERLKGHYGERCCAYIKLETDANNNKDANAFYVRNGFVLASTYETPEGRKMNEYRWGEQKKSVYMESAKNTNRSNKDLTH